MRHASSPREVPDKATANPDNVKPERQLDQEGRASATAMGKAIRDLKIPIGTVFSSPTYRALETIRYAQFGKPQPIPELGDNGKSMSGGTEAQATWLRKEGDGVAEGDQYAHRDAHAEYVAGVSGIDIRAGGRRGSDLWSKWRGGACQNRRLVETQMKLFACVLLLTGIAAAQAADVGEPGQLLRGRRVQDHARRTAAEAPAPARSPSTRCTCSIRSR